MVQETGTLARNDVHCFVKNNVDVNLEVFEQFTKGVISRVFCAEEAQHQVETADNQRPPEMNFKGLVYLVRFALLEDHAREKLSTLQWETEVS